MDSVTTKQVYLINAHNVEKWFPLSQELIALQCVKDTFNETQDIIYGIATIRMVGDQIVNYEVLSENGFDEILLDIQQGITRINRTILTINEKQIDVQISNNRKITAIANPDTDYPRIDLYLNTSDDFLLIASIEDNPDKDLRIVAYNDLSEDEPTTTLSIR